MKLRALIFGIVWAHFIYYAFDVRLFSIWYFVSIIPAIIIFAFIEMLHLRYVEGKENEKNSLG